jgi:hypothetical protein
MSKYVVLNGATKQIFAVLLYFAHHTLSIHPAIYILIPYAIHSVFTEE